jgi:hypothetical protein
MSNVRRRECWRRSVVKLAAPRALVAAPQARAQSPNAHTPAPSGHSATAAAFDHRLHIRRREDGARMEHSWRCDWNDLPILRASLGRLRHGASNPLYCSSRASAFAYTTYTSQSALRGLCYGLCGSYPGSRTVVCSNSRSLMNAVLRRCEPTPNPSIEGPCSGLRPPHAPHVKR